MKVDIFGTVERIMGKLSGREAVDMIKECLPHTEIPWDLVLDRFPQLKEHVSLSRRQRKYYVLERITKVVKGMNGHAIEAADTIAQQHGVSLDTVRQVILGLKKTRKKGGRSNVVSPPHRQRRRNPYCVS